jgi:hypothetical protein
MPVPLQAAGALSSLVEIGESGARFKRGSCADHGVSASAPHDRPRTRDAAQRPDQGRMRLGRVGSS